MRHITSNNQGFMRAKAAAAFLDIGESTFWRWVKEGLIPKGIRLSARVTVWKYEDLVMFTNHATEDAAEGRLTAGGGE